MGKYDNLIEEVKDNVMLSSFSEILESILNYENAENNLNAQTPVILDIISSHIQNQKEIVISEMIKNFEASGYTKKDVTEGIDEISKQTLDLIEQIEEEDKKTILRSILNEVDKVNREAAERYHSYNFIMPIMLEEGAHVPTYAHDSDAGADLYAAEDVTIPAHSISNLVRTGVHIQLPENWQAIIFPRSSIGMKTGLRLSNSAGVVDPLYRGNIGVIYDNISDSDYKIKQGDRIAQMLIFPVYRFKPQVVDKLDKTERGDGAYGSTGK